MTDKILEVRGLTKTYGGEKRKGAKQAAPTLDVLRGIDIDIYRGDVVCLIGPSGCGKSTFLKTLNRMNDLVPNVRIEGDVRLRGEDIFSKEMQLTDLLNRALVFEQEVSQTNRTVEVERYRRGTGFEIGLNLKF